MPGFFSSLLLLLGPSRSAAEDPQGCLVSSLCRDQTPRTPPDDAWPFESAQNVAFHLPRYIKRRLHSALGYLSPNRFEEEQARKPVRSAA